MFGVETQYNDDGLICELWEDVDGSIPCAWFIEDPDHAAYLIAKIAKGEIVPISMSPRQAIAELAKWLDTKEETAMESLITPLEKVAPGYWWARYPTKGWNIVCVEGASPFLTVRWVNDRYSCIYPDDIKDLEFGRKIEEMPEDIP